MADFLLNGRVNSDQITKDIVAAVEEATRKLKTVYLAVSTEKAEERIKKLRKLMGETITLNLSTQKAENDIQRIRSQLTQLRGSIGGIGPASATPGVGATPGPSVAPGASGTGNATQSLSRVTGAATKANNQVGKLKNTISQLDNAAISAGSSIGGPLARNLGIANSFAQSLGVNIFLSSVRLLAFATAGTAVFGVGNAIANAVTQTFALDQALTNINKVLDLNSVQLKNFKSDLIEIGIKGSTSINDIVEATTIFAQQGLKQAEILKVVNSALIAVNATGISFKEAVELITVATNSFGKSFSDSNKIVDELSTIADITAADVSDLSDILARSGATAAAAGLELEQLASIGAVVRESTRLSAETIGAGFKTILINLQANEKILNDFGVATRNINGEFIGSFGVLQNLAAAYKTMNDEQKTAISFQLTGKRRTTELTSTLENFDRVLDVQAAALSSTGSAAEKQGKQLQTLSSSVERLGATFSKFANNLAEGGLNNGLKQTIGLLDDVIGLLADFTSGLKTVVGSGILGAASIIGFFRLIFPSIEASLIGLNKIATQFSKGSSIAKTSSQETVKALNDIITTERNLLGVQLERERVQRLIKDNPKGIKAEPSEKAVGSIATGITNAVTVAAANTNGIPEQIKIYEDGFKRAKDAADSFQKGLGELRKELNKLKVKQFGLEFLLQNPLLSKGTDKLKEAEEKLAVVKSDIINKNKQISTQLTEINTLTQFQKTLDAEILALKQEQARQASINRAIVAAAAGALISGTLKQVAAQRELTGEVDTTSRSFAALADGASSAGIAFNLTSALGPKVAAVSAIIAGSYSLLKGLFETLNLKSKEFVNKLDFSRKALRDIREIMSGIVSLQSELNDLQRDSPQFRQSAQKLIEDRATSVFESLKALSEKLGESTIIPSKDSILDEFTKQLEDTGSFNFDSLPTVKFLRELQKKETFNAIKANAQETARILSEIGTDGSGGVKSLSDNIESLKASIPNVRKEIERLRNTSNFQGRDFAIKDTENQITNIEASIEKTKQAIVAVDSLRATFSNLARGRLDDVRRDNPGIDNAGLAENTKAFLKDQISKLGNIGLSQSFLEKQIVDPIVNSIGSEKVLDAMNTFDRGITETINSLLRLKENIENNQISDEILRSAEAMRKFASFTEGGTTAQGSIATSIFESTNKLSELRQEAESSKKAFDKLFGNTARAFEDIEDKAKTLGKAAKFLDLRTLSANNFKPEDALDLLETITNLKTEVARLETLEPGAAQTFPVKTRIEQYKKLQESLEGTVAAARKLISAQSALDKQTVEDNKVAAQAFMESVRKEFEVTTFKAQVELDKTKLANSFKQSMRDALFQASKDILELSSGFANETSKSKLARFSPEERIRKELNLNNESTENLFRRQIGFAAQERENRIADAKAIHDLEINNITERYSEEAQALLYVSDLNRSYVDEIRQLTLKKDKDIAAQQLKLEEEKGRAIIEESKSNQAAQFDLQKRNVDNISRAFESAIANVERLSAALASTEGEIINEARNVASSHKALVDAFAAFGNAVADFNRGVFDAKFSGLNELLNAQEATSGISLDERLSAIRKFFSENISIIGSSEKRILEIRKQFSEETINILKSKLDQLRSLGERGFTATFEDVTKRAIALAQANAIERNPEGAGRFSGVAGNPFASDLFDLAKERASFGNNRLLDILSQSGLGIFGSGESISSVEDQILEEARKLSIITERAAQLNIEQVNVARAQLATAQADYANAQERLNNLEGVKALLTTQLTSAAQQAESLGIRLNQVREQAVSSLYIQIANDDRNTLKIIEAIHSSRDTGIVSGQANLGPGAATKITQSSQQQIGPNKNEALANDLTDKFIAAIEKFNKAAEKGINENIKIDVDGKRVIEIKGLGQIEKGIEDALKTQLGKYTPKDEFNALENLIHTRILSVLSRLNLNRGYIPGQESLAP